MKTTFEVHGKKIHLTERDIRVIIMVTQGYNMHEITKELNHVAMNMASRVGDKIRRHIKSDINKVNPLICWFAYATGLVKL